MRTEQRTHPVTGTVNGLDDRAIAAFERAVRLRDPCAGLGRGDEPFAVEPEGGRAVDPALLTSFPVLHLKLGSTLPIIFRAHVFGCHDDTLLGVVSEVHSALTALACEPLRTPPHSAQ